MGCIECNYYVKNVHISTFAKQKQHQYMLLPLSLTDPGLPPKWKNIQICKVQDKELHTESV